jgi:hypothetical protein
MKFGGEFAVCAIKLMMDGLCRKKLLYDNNIEYSCGGKD